MNENKAKRIKNLEELIQELKSQLPVHSVKPEMLMHIEELEEELERLKSEQK